MFKVVNSHQTFSKQNDRLVLKESSIKEARPEKPGSKVYGVCRGFFAWMMGTADLLKGVDEEGKAKSWFVNHNSFERWVAREKTYHQIDPEKLPKQNFLDAMVQQVKSSSQSVEQKENLKRESPKPSIETTPPLVKDLQPNNSKNAPEVINPTLGAGENILKKEDKALQWMLRRVGEACEKNHVKNKEATLSNIQEIFEGKTTELSLEFTLPHTATGERIEAAYIIIKAIEERRQQLAYSRDEEFDATTFRLLAQKWMKKFIDACEDPKILEALSGKGYSGDFGEIRERRELLKLRQKRAENEPKVQEYVKLCASIIESVHSKDFKNQIMEIIHGIIGGESLVIDVRFAKKEELFNHLDKTIAILLEISKNHKKAFGLVTGLVGYFTSDTSSQELKLMDRGLWFDKITSPELRAALIEQLKDYAGQIEVEYLSQKGFSAYFHANYETSLKCYERLISLEPNADSYLGLGLSYLLRGKSGDAQKAIEFLSQAITYPDAPSEAYTRLIEIYKEEGNHAMAEEVERKRQQAESIRKESRV